MKALISPSENNRIAQVSLNDFPVSQPLLWLNCPENCTTEWTYDGSNFIEPVIPEPIIPSVVTMRQARLALLQSNLLATVEQAVSAGSEADKITWEYATEVHRSETLVQNLAVGLGLSETDLDNLFLLASSL
jgi:hypothetical protein